MSLQLPCFLLQLFFLNASCFMRQMVVQFTFTSFESSLFFPLKSLGSRLTFRARSLHASMVVRFEGVPSFYVGLQIHLVFLARLGHSFKICAIVLFQFFFFFFFFKPILVTLSILLLFIFAMSWGAYHRLAVVKWVKTGVPRIFYIYIESKGCQINGLHRDSRVSINIH